MNGIIIVNKEEGYTSNDVVQKIKRILNEKKVGHAGTLDPLATGVLPILIGEGTKISKYLINHDKTYIAIIKLGEKTDTGDSEGKVIQTAPVKKYSLEEIKMALNSFSGKQKQLPPMYSAIKKNGKKLYEYAREGIEVKREPRDIEIYNIKLNSFDESRLCFEASVSKGTYIRVLCEDIAKKLGTVGYMQSLIRTRVNNFQIANSITLSTLENNTPNIVQTNAFCSIEKFFEKNEKIILNEKELKLFLNGVLICKNLPDGVYSIYFKEFIGTGIIMGNKLKRDIILNSKSVCS